ncbi:MAG: sodium:proton antiporter [Chloroflexota bacterium]
MHESDAAGLLPVELFVVLVAVATVVAFLTRRTPLPYSVALVLAGLGIAFLVPDSRIDVSPELILAVLLPGLVFEAAYKIDIDELRRTFPVVAVLAAPGVLVTAGIVAVAVHLATGLDLPSAFVLGAIVSATDPVAVVALFKRVGAPKPLATAVESESLLNDGTGVVLFAIAVRVLSEPVTLVDGAVSFVLTVVLSAVIGLVAGVIAYRLLRATEDHLLEIAISVVAAYGTYLLADRLHQSGIIAAVVVGLVLGNGRLPTPLSERARETLDVVWEFVAFLLTALTFLLMGLIIGPENLAAALPVVVVGYVSMTLARAIVVYGVIGGVGRLLPAGRKVPGGYLHVMFWSGLRGAIAVALALALPADMPGRDTVAGAVYGIVLITLLVQGTTVGWVVRRSGVLEA